MLSLILEKSSNHVEFSRIESCHVGVANQSQSHYENGDAK